MVGTAMSKQTSQVIEAMRQNGGYATFGQLNQLLAPIFPCWETKTPQASVRRIVQTSDDFFKIQPGLWALTECKKQVLDKFQIKANKPKQEEAFTHAYYQGLVVEIGNLKHLQTYVPAQDKNHLFLETPLSQITTLPAMYDFTYPEIVQRAKTIDVVWFNERKMPHSFFEVEHTTDIQNSLGKFYELQDYFSRFYIVAPDYRKEQFDKIISRSIFASIKDRVVFRDYETIVKQHTKQCELAQIQEAI
jgi:hypothetical protein